MGPAANQQNAEVGPEPPPAKLPYLTYLDAVAGNVASLTEVLRGTPADVRVPSCPAWSLGQLGAHVGDFAAFYTHAICDATGAPRPPWPNTWQRGAAAPLNGEAPASYFDDRAQFLVSLLRSTSSDAEVRTWAKDDQTAHFVARRSAHELAVHRFDAQLAAGAPQAIGAELATDGIEEIFMMLDVRDNRGGHSTAAGGTLHIQPTDEPRDWLVVVTADAVNVSREPPAAAADLTAMGTARELELVLYGRPPVEAVDLVGDKAVLTSWYRAFTF